MVVTEDTFHPPQSAPKLADTSSRPIPILSVSSSISPAQSATSVPLCSVSDLPPRCRNEPAVLGSATGEFRRMRSVLDMKLGAMAVSLDAHMLRFDLHSSAPSDDSLRHWSPDVYDRALLPADVDCPDAVVDVFGIAIPAHTQRAMQMQHRKTIEHDDDDTAEACSTSSVSEGACSVILAESPSRLDLSALLC